MADDVITVERGVNADFTVEPYEDTALTQRTPLDPADWRVVLQVRAGPDATVALLSLDSDALTGELTIVPAPVGTPAGNIAQVHLNAAQTAGLPQSGQWEAARIDRADPSNVQPLGAGPFVVTGRMIVT